LTQLGTEVNTSDDLVSIDAAVLAYGISRSTIFRLVKAGLVRYRRPGDRKTYVSRKQLENMTSFREVN
jgi:predicted DNA-binding transcriptional regulator AlpA